jgi:UDP-N-acetylglucosamine 4,6-dehydratase
MVKVEKNKKYLVTGGSGFLGSELIKRIILQGADVVVLARDEGKLIELKEQFPSVSVYTGDICDPFDVRQAIKGVSGVFHLAAFKHVGIAEAQTRECIRTNVLGSLNILEQSSDMEIEFVVGISTDKAAQVSGVYGATKYLMERVFIQFERNFPKTNFRLVRYGNVLYSTGSVLCKWKKLLQEGKQVTVTDPNATRYFWTVSQAVDLIFECMKNSKDCAPYVPEMKSMSVGDLLTAMADKYLPPNKELKIKTIGLQQGENMHEKILENGKNSSEVERFTIEEIKKMI